MSKLSMQIQLSWTDPETGTLRQPLLDTPVALGRDFTAMPGVLDGQRVSRVVLADDRVEPFQALIVEQDGELLISNQASRNPLQINDVVLPSSTLLDGDRIQIGAVQVQVILQSGIASESINTNG
ncbi:MAG TPA: FHA domain-containing protein, partial [Allocoleopsis sp.]